MAKSNFHQLLCFNTQPPEGGWRHDKAERKPKYRFNTQPPEGGWDFFLIGLDKVLMFQHTAARRRLAKEFGYSLADIKVSTHSRPKAAGPDSSVNIAKAIVSTHSRPKAAGRNDVITFGILWFQHTAARRRLDRPERHLLGFSDVSTHSRPKAAG